MSAFSYRRRDLRLGYLLRPPHRNRTLFRNNVYIMDTTAPQPLKHGLTRSISAARLSRAAIISINNDERTIQYYVDATGTEQGSTFYYVRGPRLPEENDGVYPNAKRTF